MISHTTDQFRSQYEQLPERIKKRAQKAFTLFKDDPFHPSLHFKKIHSSKPIYSARITIDYRAIGIQEENKIIWFWIGSHTDYDRLIRQL